MNVNALRERTHFKPEFLSCQGIFSSTKPKPKGQPFRSQDHSGFRRGEPPPRSGLLGALPLWGPALPPLRAAGLLLRPATPGHSRKEKPHPLRMGIRLKKKPGDDLLSRDSSTIGAEELNFRVRDGNGWDLFAMITRRLFQKLLRRVLPASFVTRPSSRTFQYAPGFGSQKPCQNPCSLRF